MFYEGLFFMHGDWRCYFLAVQNHSFRNCNILQKYPFFKFGAFFFFMLYYNKLTQLMHKQDVLKLYTGKTYFMYDYYIFSIFVLCNCNFFKLLYCLKTFSSIFNCFSSINATGRQRFRKVMREANFSEIMKHCRSFFRYFCFLVCSNERNVI